VNRKKFFTTTLLAPLLSSLLLSACSSANDCQSLADKYWEEYQAYKDARAANGGIETPDVMAHYYASGDYYLKFMEVGCEEQGFSLNY
jgi:uncharacterized lipoprotein